MTTAATKTTDQLGIVYPDTDHMAENTLQRLMSIFLLLLLKRFLHEVSEGSLAKDKAYKALRTHNPLFCCAEQFWYYREGEPKKSIAPDVYVMPGIEPTVAPPSWKLWQLKQPPLFALEIVSDDVEKDYEQAPRAYDETLVQELIIFDPDAPKMAEVSTGRVRVRWQIWRRSTKGQWKRELESNDDRVKSEALCCWLRVVNKGDERLLRVGLGANGDELFLTGEEAALQREAFERSEKERERTEKERERSEKEQERSEKEQALARVRELEAALKKTRANPSKRRS